jgi:phosphate/sulfate permease
MDAALGLPVLIALIAVALFFDFLNGLHDAANSIATVVSTRVLRPQYAVAWAAFFNFIAFLVFGLHVAQTVGTGIVDAKVVDAAVIFGALMGAICWNLLTWWLGLPSSSSHALIGGLAGAGVTASSIRWDRRSRACTRSRAFAEAGGAATLFLATYFGIPVSTTHTITGAIVGVGAARKVAAVRWNVASNVVIAWILTMPGAALIGAAFYLVCEVWP